MVFIKWSLILLPLLMVCSARKNRCKNLITTNSLVHHQEWQCTYPSGQLEFTGQFTLKEEINVKDLMIVAVTSRFNPIKFKFETLKEKKFDFCNQLELQWQKVMDNTDFPDTLCKGTDVLEKDKTYHLNNWPIATGNLPVGWYSTNVIIAMDTLIIFRSEEAERFTPFDETKMLFNVNFYSSQGL